MSMPFIKFTYDDMPSLGFMATMPQISKACFRAYYEHTKAGLPITDFEFTYVFTEEDLAPFIPSVD